MTSHPVPKVSSLTGEHTYKRTTLSVFKLRDGRKRLRFWAFVFSLIYSDAFMKGIQPNALRSYLIIK